MGWSSDVSQPHVPVFNIHPESPSSPTSGLAAVCVELIAGDIATVSPPKLTQTRCYNAKAGAVPDFWPV